MGNILLGNCIGKGAFGSVWRGLNTETATTVAVKQINLSDIPTAELNNIMMEIDLLKNLNHPNIVKYVGFEKTSDYLNIILELCENGSLRSLCKNFGKLPEHLGAMYITQVLEGLTYLHDQGVIHRDIKGANILATKDGLVKLADFGVATLSNDVGDMSVAGTPYWMAPEIIELSGATTASDIWSVGCTVIELLDGEPPYHDLPPMGALYRIVQDDHPPIPESVSAIVRDFLMQCFQKDCNLRVSAKKLSKHPWIQMSKKKAAGSQRGREQAIPQYDEVVRHVQQWNEVLKESNAPPNRSSGSSRRSSGERGKPSGAPAISDLFHNPRSQNRESANHSHHDRSLPLAPPPPPPQFHNASGSNANPSNYEPEILTDNWDDDFADGISSFQLAALEYREQEDEVSKTIRAMPRQFQLQSSVPENDIDEGDFEDDGEELQLKIKVKAIEHGKRKKKKKKKQATHDQDGVIKPSGSLAARPKSQGPFVPVDLVRSRSAPGQLALSLPMTSDDLNNYRESEEDDFSDLFDSVEGQIAIDQDEGLALQTRISNHSWFGNDASDEEDPFAEVDEGFDEIDFEANIARGKHAKACAEIAERFDALESYRKNEKELEAACDQLITLLTENPETKGSKAASHGAIPLLDLIENCVEQSLILKLLKVLNLVIRGDFELQASLCMVGAIPVLLRYTSRRYSKEIQMAAAIFIQQICHTNPLTLQMFISCRGLRVLIDFMQGNYSTQKELVWIAINGIHSVFNLQSLTPKNDFCRLLAKQGLLDPLSASLYNTIRDPQGGPYTEKIVQVLLIFSQGDSAVKELLATRQIVHRMLNSLQSLPVNLCVMMLKCIKNISLNSNTLDVLQNASAINTLVQVLSERTGPSATDICNHVLTTMFNLCRINKYRREEAAQAGIVPHLQQIAESSSPLKQLALRILCDMAHAGRACRNILWNNDCLPFYLRLFKDPYWQVNAMDAVLVWLQDETADVEQVLLLPTSLNLVVQAFLTAKANSFENILEPLIKIIRISPSVACGIAVPPLFVRLLDRLAHPKAVVRLNLLRILRGIFEVHPDRVQLVARYGILEVVMKMAEEDQAVLVKEMARDMVEAFEASNCGVLTIIRDDDSLVEKRNEVEPNGYNSFVSRDEFFGLRHLRPLTPDEIDDTKQERGLRGLRSREPSVPSMPLQKQLLTRMLAEKGPDPQRRSQESSQNDVDDLEVKTTSIDHRRSSQQGFGVESDINTSQENHLRHRLTSKTSKLTTSDDEISSGSDDEHFVTSRAWSHDDDGDGQKTEQAGNVTKHARVSPKYDEEIVDAEEWTARGSRKAGIARQFGHQKSKSLGELLGEDIEKSSRMMESVHSDLSESMVLRRGLPKISLARLDIDTFPAWTRQDLEAGYDNEEDDDDSDGGPVDVELWQEQQRPRKVISPRSTNFRASGLRTTENLSKIQAPLPIRRASVSTSSSRSSDPWRPSTGTPIASMSHSADQNGRVKRLPPSLASITGWNSQEPIAKSAPSPGLVLAMRQEYSATLDFSDDEDEDSEENEGINGANDDDDEDEDDNDDDDDDDDNAPITNGAHSTIHGSNTNDEGHVNDHYRDDYDNDLDDSTVEWKWNPSGHHASGNRGGGGSYFMEKQEEIDWDLEEIRGDNNTPVATITSISAAASPTTGPPGSTLRRRSSHRKSQE